MTIEWMKEVFYLPMHSTHFIYGYMVKYHSDSEKGNPLPPQGLLFLISSKVSFKCTIPQTGWHILRLLLHQSWRTGWNGLDNYSVPFLTDLYVRMMPPTRRNIPIIIPIPIPTPFTNKFSVSQAGPGSQRDNITVHNPDKHIKYCQMCNLLYFT